MGAESSRNRRGRGALSTSQLRKGGLQDTGVFRPFLENSSGGTISLDEVGDLSLAMQSKLLRLLRETVHEKMHITEAIRRHGGNRKAAARELGIHPSTLFRKIKSLSIELPENDGRSRVL